tara:strand:+ start:42 stop:191 length:150 start_codon:yes stop_codon:yes gene_type:complete
MVMQKKHSMIGTADFEFKNGTTETVPKLDNGELVVNNTDKTCIIKRFDY